MKVIALFLLAWLSTGILAEGHGNYFKDRNIFLTCLFSSPNGGVVRSHHHFWNGVFGEYSSQKDKHYSFATMDLLNHNLSLNATSTKVNYVFYEWGLESELTTGCKRVKKTNYGGKEYMSRGTECPTGETIYTIPSNPSYGFGFANSSEDIYYKGDNEEQIEISLGPSSTIEATDSSNRLSISRISLRLTNVAIDVPCRTIDSDSFIEEKKDFYKERDEENKRIKDDFSL